MGVMNAYTNFVTSRSTGATRPEPEPEPEPERYGVTSAWMLSLVKALG